MQAGLVRRLDFGEVGLLRGHDLVTRPPIHPSPARLGRRERGQDVRGSFRRRHPARDRTGGERRRQGRRRRGRNEAKKEARAHHPGDEHGGCFVKNKQHGPSFGTFLLTCLVHFNHIHINIVNIGH